MNLRQKAKYYKKRCEMINPKIFLNYQSQQQKIIPFQCSQIINKKDWDAISQNGTNIPKVVGKLFGVGMLTEIVKHSEIIIDTDRYDQVCITLKINVVER